MKKNLILLLAFLLVLTACEKNKPKEDSVPYEFTYIIATEGEVDNLLFCTMEVEYLDAEGKTVKENVESLPWSKTIHNVKGPFVARMKCRTEPRSKEEIDTVGKLPPYLIANITLGYKYYNEYSDYEDCPALTFKADGKSSALALIELIDEKCRPLEIKLLPIYPR